MSFCVLRNRAVFGSKLLSRQREAVLARFFASRNGLRNGATEDSSNVARGSTTKGTIDVNVGMASRGASWYDPISIERRLSKVRGPPLIDPTTGEQIRRSPPKKSEEELWFEAGVYDSSQSTEGITKSNDESNGMNSSYPSSSSPLPSLSSSKIDEAMKDVSLFAEGRGTLVRVSSAEVHRRQLSSFTKAYELVALPAYKKLDGLVSVRLLVDDDSNVRMPVSSPTLTSSSSSSTTASKEEESDTNENMIMKPKRRLFRSQETSLENVTVTNITEWLSIDALHKAIEDEEYLAAMKVLGEFFRGKASVKNTTQFLAFDVRY